MAKKMEVQTGVGVLIGIRFFLIKMLFLTIHTNSIPVLH